MLRVSPKKQTAGYCGPCSLSMVLAYFGIEKSEAALAKQCRASRRHGTHAKDLLLVAKRYGFIGFIKDDADLADLIHWVVKKNIPVIVNWFSETEGHYSVVMDVNAHVITLQDPELGRERRMPWNTFKGVWFDFRGPYIKKKSDLVLRRMIVIHPIGG